MNPDRFIYPVKTVLELAGWSEGRTVLHEFRLPKDFEIFSAAEHVLNEFAGLKFGRPGRGIDKATQKVEIDPNLCEGLQEQLASLASEYRVKLYPLGEIDDGNAFLVIDQSGVVYVLTDTLDKIADSFDRSVEGLVLGLSQKERN